MKPKLRWLLLGALTGAVWIAIAAQSKASDWADDYTPTPPPAVLDATVKIELVPVTMKPTMSLPAGFFDLMQRRAVADVSNLFARVVEGDSDDADYVIRLGFYFDGEANPTATVIDARNGNVLATLTAVSPRKLRPDWLNVRDAMQQLKADLVKTLGQHISVPRVPPPRHHDPL
ncbi:MAG: hypothetical protein KGL11_01880 [Alphaproteobacteria bacterium]|nr:hypothetical protein [Alphaproteobacteria bacterium]